MKMKKVSFIAAVVLAVGAGVIFWQRKAPVATGASAVPDRSGGVSASVAAASLPAVPAAVPFAPSTNQTATVRGTKPYVLTGKWNFNKDLRLAAEALGARTLGVRSARALLVEADPAARARLAADGRFASVDEFLPADKISAGLADLIRSGAEFVEAGILTLTPEDRKVVLERVTAMGGEILTGCLNDGNVFRARLPSARVAELASCGDVRWLERFVRPHFVNDLAVEPAAMNVRAAWQSDENPGGLSGAGQIITTSDSGIDSGNLQTLHEDLRDRVCEIRVVPGCSATDVNGHGTHTAGSIVGNGFHSEGQIRGAAWGAQLWAWFCGAGGSGVKTPDSPDMLFRPNQANYPAFIHSASWGSDMKGAYTTDCGSYDDFVWKNADFLPVFAAGNDGRSGSQTIGSPAAAKNLLTVGATQNLRTGFDGGWGNGDPKVTAVFSSRGPCEDGRIKPDIATPGVGILSTRSHGVNYSYGIFDDYYAYDSGTSMACPLMAGAVALVREWLMRDRGFSDAEPPSAALMKAIVTGGAKDASVPNNDQGWGRFDLKDTLFPTDRAVHLIDRIPFEFDTDFAWIVETTNAAPLDVQLAWVDYPGAPENGLKPQLVNDLDLTVERMDGGDATVLYGNGGAGPDVLNNLESVRIASAEPNRYLVTVTCKDIPFDYRDGGAAALYIRGAFDPDTVKEGPPSVRIRETEACFRSLDAALAEVKSGETVEILESTRLRRTAFVTNSCTITATNASPWASMVVCRGGAQLAVTNGAAVTFTNVAFGANGDAQVKVFSNSVARLAGAIGLARIQTENWTCLELASVLTNIVEVDCLDAPTAFEPTNRVAWSSLSPAEMAESANHLFCPFDDERGGVAKDGAAVGKATLIVWQDGAPVPNVGTSAQLDQGEGDVNYRTLAALLRHYDFEKDATIKVLRDCPLESRVRLAGERALLLVGTSRATVSLAPDAGFDIVGDSRMVVSNLTFSGTVNDALFALGDREGAKGELVFGGGAVAEKVSGRSEVGGGVVLVYGGRLTMEEGSRMSGCRAERNKACGGAVYLGPGATFDLAGGEILDCYAAAAGGGVYVNSITQPATVNISGASVVIGNTSTGKRVTDDICFDNNEGSQGVFNLTGRLTAAKESVGVRFGLTGGLGGEGDAFAACDAVSAEDAEASAPVFLNDAAPRELTAAVSDAELVWEKNPLGPGGCEPELANVRVVYPDGVTNYYEHVANALAGMTGPCDLELLRNDTFLGELTVAFDVTLRTAPEVGGALSLARVASGRIMVKPGVALKVEDVRVNGGRDSFVAGNLIAVDGGSLELKSGADVGNVLGGGSRADGVITVYHGGRLLMEEGSIVSKGANPYYDYLKDVDSGVGGGILVDGESVAEFKGGQVVSCQASRGGGVAVANKSTAYVSGNFTATGNTDRSGDPNDYVTEDKSALVLADDFTGSVGISEGIACDTNVFGRVDGWRDWDLTSLTNSAARFFRDDANHVRGIVVSNASETALLIWRTAVSDDGTYTDEDGNVYAVVSGLVPGPEPRFADPEPIAFSYVGTDDRGATWTLRFTNAVQWCVYSVYGTNSLAGGFCLTNAAGKYVIAPATNFQWKSAAKEIEVRLPGNGTQRFWRAVGARGEIPNED